MQFLIFDIVFTDGVKANTLVVLVNVLYFKDAWKDDPFIDSTNTFQLGDGTTVDTDFMESDFITVGYKDLANTEIVCIPFETDDYYFVILLPKENSGSSQKL